MMRLQLVFTSVPFNVYESAQLPKRMRGIQLNDRRKVSTKFWPAMHIIKATRDMPYAWKSDKTLNYTLCYFDFSAKARSLQLANVCEEKMGIRLTNDYDVDYEQMTSCCEQLLRNTTEFASIKGLEMRITSNYYAIFDSGQFCIPWDWKVWCGVGQSPEVVGNKVDLAYSSGIRLYWYLS